MGNTKFPLTEALGLKAHDPLRFALDAEPVVLVNDLERALERAPVVTTGWEPAKDGMGTTHVWRTSYEPHPNPTDTARLVCIQPIKQKSREEQLEELVRDMLKFKDRGNGLTLEMHDYLERARALVEGK